MAKPFVASQVTSPGVLINATTGAASLLGAGGIFGIATAGNVSLSANAGDLSLSANAGSASVSAESASLTASDGSVTVTASDDFRVTTADDIALTATSGDMGLTVGGALTATVTGAITQAAGQGVAISAVAGDILIDQNNTGAGLHMTAAGPSELLSPDDLFLVSSNGTLSLQQIGNGESIELTVGGNIELTNGGGNISASASTVFLAGDAVMAQNMITPTVTAALNPADPDYPELTNSDVGLLATASWLTIVPDAGGTTIHSLFPRGSSNQNPPRVIWVQNVGSAGDVILSNQSGSGTTGGLFLGPGDVTIPPGGGTCVKFDETLEEWLVNVLPSGGSGGGILFDTILSPPTFTFPNNDVSLALGLITLVKYTTDATRAFRGLVNSNGGNTDGLIACFLNENATPSHLLQLIDEDTGSSPANRFRVTGGGSASGNSAGAVWIRYDGATSRWQQFINTSGT